MTLGAGEATSVAFCWTLERRDGAGLGLTSHDRALMVDGITYRPSPAITPASVRLRAGLEPIGGEVEGVLSDAALSEHDLEAGRWDGARVALFAIDWQAPDAERIDLVGGGLGPVSIKDEGFAAELVGAAAALAAPVSPETSPECRAELGDRQCRIDLAGRRVMVSIVAAADESLTISQPVASDYEGGEASIFDGPNGGWRTRVARISGSVLWLRDVPPFAIAAGCRIRLTQGCDKRLETCRTRFANSVNFRGEPHLPGNDLLTRYPGA